MKQGQKNRYFSVNKIAGASGQAAVEYILLMVIIVAMILGAKKGFASLNRFMNSYIGDYISCLMEYGELPTLGIGNADLKKHSESGGKVCDTKFEGFAFDKGRPPTSSGGASSAGKKSSGSDSSGGGGAGASKSRSSSGSDGSGGGNKGTSDKSPYRTGQIDRESERRTGDSSQNSKIKIIEDEEDPRGRRPFGGRSRVSRGRYYNEKYNAITGKMAEEIEKNSRRLPKGPSSRVVASSEGNRFGPYKKTINPADFKKSKPVEEQPTEFSFGYMMKWLIIGGMILAIIVFFGGQIMNYNNSQD